MKHRFTLLSLFAYLILANFNYAQRPNIILILLDDFGVGQFAPIAKTLSEEEISWEHQEFVQSLGEYAYPTSLALEFSKKAMPTMDKLANEGCLFTHAYSSSNLCAPARTGILTGRQHIKWGSYRNMDINIRGLPKGSVLAEQFQQSGYTTGFIGKWHVAGKNKKLKNEIFKKHNYALDAKIDPFIKEKLTKSGYFGSVDDINHPLNNGFDYYFGYNKWECPFYYSELIWENFEYKGLQKQYNTDQFTDKAVTFISKSIGAGKPFFIEVAYHAMHSPLQPIAPEKYTKKFQSGHEYLDKFYAHLYAVDANIQRMVDHLKNKGELENTLIVFTSDNGATCTERSVLPGNTPHRGYKGSFFQGGFKVPLVMWYPKGFKRTGVIEKMVSTMDILPTALDVAGIQVPNKIEGKSLQKILNNRHAKSPHDHLIWAGIHSRAWGFDRSKTPGGQHDTWRDRSPAAWVIIKDPYLLRYTSKMPANLHPDVPEGYAEETALYDLRKDPLERENLIKRHPELAKSMEEIYWKFAKNLPEPYYQIWSKDSWEKLLHK